MAFVGSSGVSIELPLSREGDEVTIHYEDGGNALVDIMEFDNARLAFQRSAAQQAVDAYADSVRTGQREDRDDQNMDAAWEALSPEEKTRLMNGGRGT